MYHELEQLTRPISQLTREDLTEDKILDGLEVLSEAFSALGALTAAYGDHEWDALMDYDARLMDVIEPLIRAAVLLKSSSAGLLKARNHDQPNHDQR